MDAMIVRLCAVFAGGRLSSKDADSGARLSRALRVPRVLHWALQATKLNLVLLLLTPSYLCCVRPDTRYTFSSDYLYLSEHVNSLPWRTRRSSSKRRSSKRKLPVRTAQIPQTCAPIYEARRPQLTLICLSHEEEDVQVDTQVDAEQTETPTSPIAESAPAEVEQVDPIKKAEETKERGNVAFKALKFPEAIEIYSQAIGAYAIRVACGQRRS